MTRWQTMLLSILLLAGCGAQSEVDPCPQGDIHEGDFWLETAADANALQCFRIITGSLVVTAPDLEELGPQQLYWIGDGLIVQGAHALRSLAGLETLERVTGISLIGNERLESLKGLEGVTELRGDITLRNNPALNSLQGIPALSRLDSLSIGKSPLLEDLSSLEGVDRIEGWLTLDGLGLRDLRGLDLLTRVDGSLKIANNEQLESLTGLGWLGSIDGSLSIYGNPRLRDLVGLDYLYSVGSLSVILNHDLVSTEGLLRLQETHGKMTFRLNHSLERMVGFEGLEFAGCFEMDNNHSLDFCAFRELLEEEPLLGLCRPYPALERHFCP